jgi:hypothetical protein
LIALPRRTAAHSGFGNDEMLRHDVLVTVNRNFTQTITIHSDRDSGLLLALSREWDALQATADIMGYSGQRILADRDTPGRYVVVADFAVVDPAISAYEEAMKNNDRAQTQDFSRRLNALVTREPVFNHYDELYRTDFDAGF